MVLVFVSLMVAHLVIATLVAINSVLEAERDRLTAKDILVVALVGALWPLVGCVLLLMPGRQNPGSGKRQFLRTTR